MFKILKNKKGVTLAELLAVVTIMGIIAAVAVPIIGNVIEDSRKDAFVADAAAIKDAVRTYCITADLDPKCDGSGDFSVLDDTVDTGVTNLLSKNFTTSTTSEKGTYSVASATVDSTTGKITVVLEVIDGYKFSGDPSGIKDKDYTIS